MIAINKPHNSNDQGLSGGGVYNKYRLVFYVRQSDENSNCAWVAVMWMNIMRLTNCKSSDTSTANEEPEGRNEGRQQSTDH